MHGRLHQDGLNILGQISQVVNLTLIQILKIIRTCLQANRFLFWKSD